MPIAGTWYNELGSEMNLSQDGASITGTYWTAVGDASSSYQLVGSLDVDGDPNANGQAVAWVVAWNNEDHGSSHSVTAWSGQYQVVNGEEEISTLWLLTQESPSNADWAATTVNQDVFTRNQPSTVQTLASQKRGKIPHPI